MGPQRCVAGILIQRQIFDGFRSHFLTSSTFVQHEAVKDSPFSATSIREHFKKFTSFHIPSAFPPHCSPIHRASCTGCLAFSSATVRSCSFAP
jgi:hypothetical protein